MARKFQDGEKVMITESFPKYLLTQWGLNVGDTVTINSISYDGHYNIQKNDKTGGGTYRVSNAALSKLVEGGKRAQLLDHIKKAEEKIKQTKAFIEETKTKITFMDETGSDVFNENEFKAYQTLIIIEKGDLSKMEKAKAIAALIDKK